MSKSNDLLHKFRRNIPRASRQMELAVMAEDNNLPAPLDFGFSHDIDVQPMSVEKARKELEIGVNVIPAADLVGQRFIILGAKPFESRFEGQDFAYFCECTDLKRSEVWGVVIGGGQPVQFITDYIGKGAPAPLVVTLKEQEGGRYGKYYVLE